MAKWASFHTHLVLQPKSNSLLCRQMHHTHILTTNLFYLTNAVLKLTWFDHKSWNIQHTVKLQMYITIRSPCKVLLPNDQSINFTYQFDISTHYHESQQQKLDTCIVWKAHNTVFSSKHSAVSNMWFLGPTRVLNWNGILIASAVSAGLTKWKTDRQTTLLSRQQEAASTYVVLWCSLHCVLKKSHL